MKPYYVAMVELTNHCTMNCVFCNNSKMTRKRGYMEKSLAFKIIDEIVSEKLSNMICFHVMGEALLHPDVFEVTEYAHEKGLFTQLNTNGILLNPENRTKILSSNLSRIDISYASPTGITYNATRNGTICFDEWQQNIADFLRGRIQSQSKLKVVIPIGVTFPSTKAEKINKLLSPQKFKLLESQEEVDKAKLQLAFKIGGVFARLSHSIRAGDLKFIENCLSDHNIHFYNRYYSNWISNTKYKLCWGSCSCPDMHFSILWNGDLTICDLDFDGRGTIGNVNNSSIKGILTSPKMLKFRDELKHNRLILPVCQDCRGKNNILQSFLYQMWNVFKR